MQQRLARAHRGSHRRARTKLAIARVRARETDRRRDWVEKTATDVARRFDTIRVEDLNARNIAAGRAVTARGDLGASQSANREPQPCSPAARVRGVEIHRLTPVGRQGSLTCYATFVRHVHRLCGHGRRGSAGLQRTGVLAGPARRFGRRRHRPGFIASRR
ncbi:transposase [Candidatus Mycobacterium methanotrophicum]|uniref:Transposase n=1 Tax=Candidatus Mycobacterium methanotrophicum TaxID=2943498 RepID=A0ABY4QQE3_9MYCO|nr:transposase [Candidatus Mycobacterium methanotrophicum]UQX11988.1 transposase [Candidatus Mycobacterium methanotrophicum]